MRLLHQVSGPVISQASDKLQGLVGAHRELYLDQFAGQFKIFIGKCRRLTSVQLRAAARNCVQLHVHLRSYTQFCTALHSSARAAASYCADCAVTCRLCR